MEPEPVENWREKRADPDAWTFKKAQRARHLRARRDLSWESKRLIGPKENFVSSSTGTGKPQRGLVPRVSQEFSPLGRAEE